MGISTKIQTEMEKFSPIFRYLKKKQYSPSLQIKKGKVICKHFLKHFYVYSLHLVEYYFIHKISP